MGYILGTRFSPIRACAASVNFGEEFPHRRMLRKKVTTGPVVTEQIVIRMDQRGERCRHGLLADTKMDWTPYLIGWMVFAKKCFLSAAQSQHLPIQQQ